MKVGYEMARIANRREDEIRQLVTEMAQDA
jgi:hypothetical protein